MALKTGFCPKFWIFGLKIAKIGPKTGKNQKNLKKITFLAQNLDFLAFLTSKSEKLANFLSKKGLCLL